MNERKNIITMKGSPLTLMGNEVKVGGKAPEFKAVDKDLNPVSLSDYLGKTIIISSVPSLDTPVCDMQTRRFNREATRMSHDLVLLTISMDLPFAQKRWCGNAGMEEVLTISDHKEASFGLAYGLLIKELRLLARAVLVIDKDGIIKYQEIVPEVTQEPDYDKALDSAGEVLETV